jgi:predicted nucleotidyltransferase
MKLEAAYPTPEHQKAAEAITEHFASNFEIDAVLLVNSCARGKATRDSCLDIIMLARPDPSRTQIRELEAGWEGFEKSNPALQCLSRVFAGYIYRTSHIPDCLQQMDS